MIAFTLTAIIAFILGTIAGVKLANYSFLLNLNDTFPPEKMITKRETE